MTYSTILRKILFASVMVLGTAEVASAALYNHPVASNAYIHFGGRDWAWASPVAANGSWGGASSAIDLSYQGAFGWRLPTAAELLNAPAGLNFMFSGANVPLGGTDPLSGSYFGSTSSSLVSAAACASAYFTNMFRHCDWGNGGSSSFPWWGQVGASAYSDSLVVRTSPVPVPAALPLLAGALVGLGALAKRRRKASSSVA